MLVENQAIKKVNFHELTESANKQALSNRKKKTKTERRRNSLNFVSLFVATGYSDASDNGDALHHFFSIKYNLSRGVRDGEALHHFFP